MGYHNPRESFKGMIKLHSEDHEEILDVIDQLRSEGISKYVGLPQLVVCGDQSSGKSSVLEAISGLDFPRKDNLCTRFPTEFILRKASEEAITVSILPDDSRTPSEKERLRNFKPHHVSLEHFADIIQSAGELIGIDKDGMVFSKDILRVELQSPEQSHLTLVDLPGLYHAPDESQDEKGVALVESLVSSYLQNPRSVILAVISAKNDIALQKVTALTRKVDPHGARTMGIITKPDTLSRGSEMEHSFHQLATNSRPRFKLELGWHVVKNRNYEERDTTLVERCASEMKFLSEGVWATVPHNQTGIESLRPRLSTVLRDHILSSLPGLIEEAQRMLRICGESLHRLGQARQTLADQRRYLLLSSERFTLLISNAVYGVYYDPYFGDAMSDEGYEKRLRAVIQNHLTDFSENMRNRGESKKIVDDEMGTEDTESQIRRSSFIVEVQQRMRRTRGCELPGTYSPLIIGDLFYIHARPWKALTMACIELLILDSRKAVTSTLQAIVDNKSYEGLLRHIINPKLDELEDSLRSKASELLQPQQNGHPITYNHYFTDCIQNAREKHQSKILKKKLRTFFPKPQYSILGEEKHTFEMDKLVSALAAQTEADMEKFACSEVIDCMTAYYKVARKKYVDDFSNLAVEKCFVEPLTIMFSSRVVEKLTDGVIEEIAAEDESSKVERQRLEEKVSVLQASLQQLRRLDRHHLAETQNIDDECSTGSSLELRDADDDDNFRVEGESARGEEEPLPIDEEVPDVDQAISPVEPFSKKQKKHRNANIFE